MVTMSILNKITQSANSKSSRANAARAQNANEGTPAANLDEMIDESVDLELEQTLAELAACL